MKSRANEKLGRLGLHKLIYSRNLERKLLLGEGFVMIIEMHLNKVRIGNESIERIVKAPEFHKCFHREP